MTESFTLLRTRLDWWRRRTIAWGRRATRSGLGLRALVWLSGFAGLILAAPPLARPAGVTAALLLPLAPMFRPGGFGTSLVMFTGFAEWVVGHWQTAQPSLWTAGFIGIALYVHHATASLAARCPVDTAVDAPVLRGWAARTGSVAAGAVVLCAGVAVLAGRPLPVSPSLLVVAGAVGAVLVCGWLVILVSRR